MELIFAIFCALCLFYFFLAVVLPIIIGLICLAIHNIQWTDPKAPPMKPIAKIFAFFSLIWMGYSVFYGIQLLLT